MNRLIGYCYKKLDRSNKLSWFKNILKSSIILSSIVGLFQKEKNKKYSSRSYSMIINKKKRLLLH